MFFFLPFARDFSTETLPKLTYRFLISKLMKFSSVSYDILILANTTYNNYKYYLTLPENCQHSCPSKTAFRSEGVNEKIF